jgi:ribosome-interacting GTPase 1
VPANLPAEAKAAWLRVIEARTVEDKIRAMEEFLSKVPRHKGTEKLIRYARKRVAELRRELRERREKERALRRGGSRVYVAKDGDLQVVVVGPPSSGKTALLRCLTNTTLQPDDLPFSTVEPVPSMFIEGGVYVQLVKAPSIVPGGESDFNNIALALARNADAALLVLSAGSPPELVREVLELFEEGGVCLYPLRNYVRVERRGGGGIQIVGPGRIVDGTLSDVVRMLREYGIYHATVRISGSVTLSDIEESLYIERQYKPALVVLTMGDLYTPGEDLLKRMSELGLPHYVTDLRRCAIDRGRLLEGLLRVTDRIRVFTKPVHSKTYISKPLVVKAGTTAGDVAAMIHSSLAKTFKYAIVWRRETYPLHPKRVGRDYALSDNDVIEIHA